MEYAILQELGFPHVPVVTTVHPAQIVADIEVDAHDLPLDFIVTPEETIVTDTPYPKPKGIAWELLDVADLQAMPVLGELRRLKWESFSTRNLLALRLPRLVRRHQSRSQERASGHNFAGPGNHFWRLLYDGFGRPAVYSPAKKSSSSPTASALRMSSPAASRGEGDLSWDELVAGGVKLRATVERWRPGLSRCWAKTYIEPMPA